MFTAALFTIARTRKQLKSPSTGEWIKLWYIHTMAYYSAIRRKEMGSFSVLWTNPESVTRSEESQKAKNNIVY